MAVFANARCCSITFSRLMMMLLIFVLCCSVFQVFVVAVLVLSRGNFLVFISNENEMTMSSKSKIFDASCLSKMMILLIFVLCVSGFRRGCAGVIERRRFHFFFCRSSPSLCSLATSRRYASILQSLWFMCILVAI